MSSMNKLQEAHDQLIASMPQGTEHSKEDCPFCNGLLASLEGGSQVGDKTYTDDEVKAQIAAAVAEATSDAKAEIAVLKAAEEAAKKNPFAKDDDAEDKKDGGKDEDKEKTALEAQIAELNTKLDAAIVELEAAKTERDGIVSWLDSEAAKVVEEAEKATLRAERISKVAEVITFPEDRVNERADQWVALDEPQFEALLADYKVMGEKAGSHKREPLPAFTAMQASRDANTESSAVGSALKDLIRGRHTGVDPRAIR